MKKTKLNKILDDHKLWLKTGGKQGERANLRSADLSYADLRLANLRSADLSSANLSSADLNSANLDFSAFPLWCGGLNVHIDDKQAKQLLYHLIQNVQYSKNTTKTMKKSLLTKTILKKANEFHRIGEVPKIEEEKNG